MIISKRKFNEKVREALEQAERERWIHEKIDRVERECQTRLDGMMRHLMSLEEKVALLTDEKKRAKGGE